MKPKKKIYTNHLREGLEAYLAFTVSIASITTNSHRLTRERLESHPSFTYRHGLRAQPRSNQRHGFRTRLAVTVTTLLQIPLTFPISHPHLTKHLAQATFYGMDIVVIQRPKSHHLLPAVYANIFEKWLLIWF